MMIGLDGSWACSAASNIGVSQKKKKTSNIGDREMELGRCFAACFIRNELQSGVIKKIRSHQIRWARKEHSHFSGWHVLASIQAKGNLISTN
jgi:hypothetical protein